MWTETQSDITEIIEIVDLIPDLHCPCCGACALRLPDDIPGGTVWCSSCGDPFNLRKLVKKQLGY